MTTPRPGHEFILFHSTWWIPISPHMTPSSRQVHRLCSFARGGDDLTFFLSPRSLLLESNFPRGLDTRRLLQGDRFHRRVGIVRIVLTVSGRIEAINHGSHDSVVLGKGTCVVCSAAFPPALPFFIFYFFIFSGALQCDILMLL